MCSSVDLLELDGLMIMVMLLCGVMNDMLLSMCCMLNCFDMLCMVILLLVCDIVVMVLVGGLVLFCVWVIEVVWCDVICCYSLLMCVSVNVIMDGGGLCSVLCV